MLSWYTGGFKPFRAWVVVALLLGVAVVLTGMGLMVASGRLLSEAALRPPILDLMVIVTAVRFFALSRAALRYLERLVSHDVTFRLLRELRVRVYQHLVPLAPLRLWDRQGGDLLARLIGDVENLQNVYIRLIAPAISSVVIALVTVGALALIDLKLALAVGGCHVLAGWLIPGWLSWHGHRLGVLRQRIKARISAQATETLAGRVALAHWGRAPLARRRWLRLAALEDRVTGVMNRLVAWQEGMIQGVTWTGMILSLVFAIPLVQRGELAGVLLAAIALGVMATFEGVAALASAIHLLGSVQESGARIQQMEQLPPAMPEPVSAMPLPDGPLSFVLDEVGAAYGEQNILDGICLDLAPGRAVAVVGPNCSGKSTLARLLTRVLEPTTGTLLVSGVDATTLSARDVRERLAIVSQKSHLFMGTLREHFQWGGDPVTDNEIDQLLELVRLRSWAVSLPDGLQTQLGEGGAMVSGGEAQRLVLARALARRDRMLILDEPLNHVDPETADAIIADILPTLKQNGGLLISHRLAGLSGFDEILVIDSGRVAQRGDFPTLCRQPGLFREMLNVELDVMAP